MAEIDRDLVRWKRSTWLSVTALFIAVQVAALVLIPQEPVTSREVYPREPVVTIAGDSSDSEWSELENPFLFAAASWNGFSADAWLQKPQWRAPATGLPVPMRLLGFADMAKQSRPAAESQAFTFLQRQRPVTPLPGPPETPRRDRKSELRLEGLDGRKVLNQPALPGQTHTDVLSRTVIEALVSADGLVISAHIVENSGSAKADADAMALTRKTRFSPKAATNQPVDLGKLIFEWHAVDLSQTNSGSSLSPNVVR